MSGMKEIKKDYGKLKKEYPQLPDLRDFMLIFGYPKEDELKSVVRLYFSCKKTPSNAAHVLVNLMSPKDSITAQDQKFTRDMKDELMEGMKTCAIVEKRMSLGSFEAAQSKDPEKILAQTLADAVEELKPVAELFQKVLKRTLKGWEDADTSEEHVSYRW